MSRVVDPDGGRPDTGGPPSLPDDEIVGRVLAGETSLFEVLMRRYNQRLFRTVRAMVSDDAEAEDILQEAYVRAYRHLGQFAGRARFSTWLTRIAIHEAFARRRRRRPWDSLDEPGRPIDAEAFEDTDPTPEQRAASSELRATLERAIEAMPENLRVVFTLREVEGLDTDETAECLGLSPGNVKVRLHRARSRLRTEIDRRLGEDVRRLHQFAGQRCDSIVRLVLARIESPSEEREG